MNQTETGKRPAGLKARRSNYIQYFKDKSDQARGRRWAAGLFLLALVVRIPYLWTIPRYIDETGEIKIGYLIYSGQAFPLHNAAHDLGSMHNYLLALVFKVLGPSVYTPRLYVAILGAFTVVLAYYLGRRMFGHYAGVLAGLLLATNGMHMLVTHKAWGNCATPFFFMIALMATMNAEERKSGLWLVIAGLLWSLTLQTHISIIVYIITAAIYVLRRSFREKTGIASLWYWMALLAALAGYANMILYNLQTRGGSIIWMTKKGYAIESDPGVHSYFVNLWALVVEFLRTLGSVYYSYVPADSWKYLLNPLFLIPLLLVVWGVLAARRNQRSSLPLWMILATVLVFPWINKYYDFYIATRYLMPVVVCAIVYEGAGALELGKWLKGLWDRRFGARDLSRWGWAIVALVVVAQAVPFYYYCYRTDITDQSNRMVLEALAGINDFSEGDTGIPVILDNSIPMFNRTLPDLLMVEGYPNKMVVLERVNEELENRKEGPVLAVLSEQAYHSLPDTVKPVRVNTYTQHIGVPDGDLRTVYLLELNR